MKTLLVNHQYTPIWLKDYPELDYFIIDQSEDKEWLKDFPQERIQYVKNVGNCDYQKLLWLIENYDNLPEVFLWGKTNIFKYVSEEDLKEALKRGTSCPLLKKDHKTYADRLSTVCYYDDSGTYWERNDSWFVPQFARNFSSINQFAQYLCIPQFGHYIPFNPGGNFILTKERVHRYGKEFYEAMANTLPHDRLPCEAQFCERIYFTLWS